MKIKRAELKLDKQQQGKKIPEYLFSHFIEDIRDHIGCMMAYPLSCMDFENEAEQEPGVSGGWRGITNGKTTKFALEPPMRYHSGHSQMIRLFSDDDSWAGICQTVCVKKGGYCLSLVARAAEQITGLKAGLYAENGELIDQVEIGGLEHRFKRFEARLRADRTYERAVFAVTADIRGKVFRDNDVSGKVWIDHVSLLAENHVERIDADVFHMIRELKPKLIRLAGNYISAYHWEDFTGPVLERAAYINEVWGGQASRYFGTDEFLRLCERLGCEAMICLNVGSGSVEEAREWMEYCLGGAETPYGALRAENGHPEPYRVAYWEIGNEIWGEWQMGHCSAEAYSQRYLEYYKALKAKYPEQIFLACGSDRPLWNEQMLSRIHGSIDELSIHYYHGFTNRPEDESGRFSHMSGMAEAMDRVLRDAKELLVKYGDGDVRICVTEYNTMYYNMAARRVVPHEHTMEAAVANAGCLNTFLRRADWLDVCNFSDLVNGWLGGIIRVGDHYADQLRGRKDDGSRAVYGTASYEVMKLYAQADMRYQVPVRTLCDTYDADRFVSCSFRPEFEYRDLPEIDAAAAAGPNGMWMFCFVVNRSGSQYEINMEELGEYGGLSGYTAVFADDLREYNSAHGGRRIQVETEDTVGGCRAVVRPYSVNRFIFRRSGQEE